MKNKWIMIGLLTCFLCGCGSNSETYMELADRYFATGQYDYAAYNYVRVLENDRENEEVYAKLIDAYIAQEKFEKAMNYLEEAEVMFGKEKMEDKRVLVESLLADVTPEPTVTPTLTPKATATPRPTATPKPTVTPTQAPTPTERPKPKASVTPIQAPTATEAPKETETPKPMETGKVTEQPTATPKPTSVLKPTATPKPVATPKPTPITMPDATAESCFEWKEYSDGTVGVAKYIGKNIKEVVVPKEASGKKVTRIGYDAFENSDIERIILPETIEVIGAGAFQECKKLSEAVLSDGLKTIGVDAFRGCISMKEFMIPESVEEVYIGAFDNCFSLKELHIPKDVNSFYFVYDAEYTEDTPIYGCDALTSLTVAKENPYYFAENGILYRSWAENEALAFHVLDNVKGVVNLSERATGIVLDMLEGKDEIKQIVLADSVGYIDCTYGAYSDYVDRLKIDAANPYYSLKDGVLYSKKDNTLLALSKDAAGSYYEVPAGTKTISRGAFVNCTELETIKLPASFEYDQFTNYANVFRGNVKELQLAEGNSSFKITNDALLTADGVELLYVPSGLEIKNYRVPEGVRNIYDGAFRNNSTLESVTIPESVRWIETYAFSGCDNLTTIYAKKDSYAEGWALKHEYQVKEP